VIEQDTHIARQEPVFTEDNFVNVEFRGQIGETLVKSGLVDGQATVPGASGDSVSCTLIGSKEHKLTLCSLLPSPPY
jgi:hypothetical protein